MVKEWDRDKAKQDVGPVKAPANKRKSKDAGIYLERVTAVSSLPTSFVFRGWSLTDFVWFPVVPDELASLSISETDVVENGGSVKEGDSNADEPVRWRPKVTLRRYVILISYVGCVVEMLFCYRVLIFTCDALIDTLIRYDRSHSTQLISHSSRVQKMAP